jgi:hypothetical protein
MDDFVLSPQADTSGVGLVDEVVVAPATVVSLFGRAVPGEDSKVSGWYVFTDQAGRPFVLCDWKTTSRYDPSFPSPDEYWGAADPQVLSIGGLDEDVSEFKAWLLERLGRGIEQEVAAIIPEPDLPKRPWWRFW